MSQPSIHILLATYNGARYLRQQWVSLEAQEGVQLVVHVADDGSTDGTVNLLRQLAQPPRGAIRDVQWLDAPLRRSATRSFQMLLADASARCPDAEWFAYCDQDDVWLPGKLAAAHAVLAPYAASERPALYGGRTLAVDEEDREGGLSPLFARAPSFRNAVAQNIMGGNTMVMNRAAAQLVAGSADADVPTHDWFAYQLVTGVGGVVHYDARPMVRYRQHGTNVIGSNLGWRARWRRLQRTLRGDYTAWSDANLAALRLRETVLTADSRAVLTDFERARQARTPWDRARWLARSGVFRQKAGEQMMLWMACLLGRM